jgi:hypothetical protein
MEHALDVQLRRWKLAEVLAGLPRAAALNVTSDPCQCAECRQAGKVGFPEPLDTPHHFTWCCAGHALKRIKLSYYKRKAAFQRPCRNSTRRQSDEISV